VATKQPLDQQHWSTGIILSTDKKKLFITFYMVKYVYGGASNFDPNIVVTFFSSKCK
jgi:hypothetical protein